MKKPWEFNFNWNFVIPDKANVKEPKKLLKQSETEQTAVGYLSPAV